jgi:predicted GTPase
MAERERIVIMGAAGRDFHNFNVVYRDDPTVEVVAFTAAQIPGIDDRRYPPALAGALYPLGIPIEPEERLEEICRAHSVDTVVFAYSDVPHLGVMHRASRALALGADFELLGPNRTWLTSRLPVISVTAARTGSGKSPLSRWITRKLRDEGRSVAVLRHPMPYGDLEKQRVQRFASRADLDAADCTVEEREEYESHLAEGSVVFAGVDYGQILERAEQEADCIVWDGGNNDFGFIKPSVSVAVLDCLRAEQADQYHPGEAVLRMADIVVLSKVDSAAPEQVAAASAAARGLNARAEIVAGALPVRLDDPAAVTGRRVLVIEDGPTVTHGGMSFGAGFIAAKSAGAAEILEPREIPEADLQATLARYPHLGSVVPALGYDAEQLEALRRWIEASAADVVVSGSPVDLQSLLALEIPVVRARYEFEERGEPRLWAAISRISGLA